MKKISACLLTIVIFFLTSCTFDAAVLTPPSPSVQASIPMEVPPLPQATQSVTAPLIPGDLGWGKLHGKVMDASTSQPIAGVTITCEHHSYTSPLTCSGSAITSTDGIYIFKSVFFHDTDTIKLTVQAPGYQTQEITQTSFTMPDMETNIVLNPAP